jgi:superfamily II DNA or RNA helicase
MSGKLITNQETTLSDLFSSILPKTKDVCFLVGYFYFSGFPELYKNLKDKKLRILVGLDIDVDIMNRVREYEQFEQKRISKKKDQDNYYTKFVKLFNNTDFFDTEEKQEAFKLFYEKIKDGTLEIRKTAEPNHAKMYLFDDTTSDPTLPGHMIVGSSNLSIQGLKKRNELNVVFHDTDYNDGKKLFDKLWNTATPIADIETLQSFETKVVQKIWFEKLPSPYSIYLRILKEYFEIKFKDNEFRSPHSINSKYLDFEYQTDAIKSSLDKINRHNGVVIADVVGLGKSIIASAIASNINKPVVIITPPHLKSQWVDYSREFCFYHRAHIYTNGKIDEAVKDYAFYPDQLLVIIDEAHKYRNSKNRDYLYLHQLCQGNKVVLLTATPYNNRPQDVYSLLKLFQIPGKSTLKNIDNLGTHFEALIAEYNKVEKLAKKSDSELNRFNKTSREIANKILNIISPVVIRRSRKDLEIISRYKKDLEKQGISFPKVNDPVVKEYDLGKVEHLYVNTLDAIYAKGSDDDEILCSSSYMAARYQPLQYIKNEKVEQIRKKIEAEGMEFDFFQRSQKNLANFMRRLLVHRFESSISAFKISLENMISTSENILNWIRERKTIPVYKRGNLPDIEEMMYTSNDDGPDMFGKFELDYQIEKLNAKGLFEISIDDIRPEFIGYIQNDLLILNKIKSDWFGRNNQIKIDPKLNNFSEEVKKMLAIEPNRKIVVFTEFADTAQYLYEKLLEKGLPVFSYSSRIASEHNKKVIRENFDAGIPLSEQKNDYSILIATDAISEGYNLHRAGTVFNYDIPYNPTRVIQRIGRINRVNKKVFDELYIYNYFPSVIGERDVKVKRISTIKMRMIHAIMGGDMKILTEDEQLFFSEFNKKFREMEDLAEQKSWDAEFREEWEQSKNTPLYENALSVCQRSKIARMNTGHDGIIIFGKRGDECVFKWGNGQEENIALLPEQALPVFKAAKDEAAYKVSDNFYSVYNVIKESLFNGKSSPLSKMRGKALAKVKAWSSETDEAHDEYLELLQKVIEIDGLPEYSQITGAKKYNDVKEKVSLSYLERILDASEKIDAEPENVILAEELL